MLNVIKEYAKSMISWEYNKEFKRFMPGKIYVGMTLDNSEYRFHVNQLHSFIAFIRDKGLTLTVDNITKIDLYEPARLTYPTHITKELRDYQSKAIDHIVNKDTKQLTRFLGLPTGTGKTFTGLYACATLGKRVVIIILPNYISKWVLDIQENLGVSIDSIITVQGSGQLRGLIDLAQQGILNKDYIIISIRTMQNYIDFYESYPQVCEDDYGCLPDDFYKILQAGTVLIDETHQHFYAVYKTILYMHVSMLISLSATLISDDNLISKIHNIVYPKEIRYDDLLMEKYIYVYAVDYSYRNFLIRKIQTREFGRKEYSHNAYEKSIMRNKEYTLTAYLGMIVYMVRHSYMDRRVPGDRLLVYASTIQMCGYICKCLKDHFPELDVRTYTQDDSYDNVMNADITVSNIQKAGTALDIPNLIAVIQTISISSSVSNLQSLGRLRKLKDKEVRYYYLYCSNIEKHKDYHQKRMELFAPKVVAIKQLAYHTLL